MPFTGRFFFSTEQDNFHKSFNLFQIRLAPKRRFPNKPGVKFTKLKKFLNDFETLELGVCYPNYSKLLIQGPRIRGINLEYNPGLFYISCLAGNASQLQNAYDKRYLMTRIGVGKKKKTHFYLGLLHVQDNFNIEDSIPNIILFRIWKEENVLIRRLK